VIDLIALGETMMSFAPSDGGHLGAATTFAASPAGAESNTCVGLARLGHRTAWISRLGADPCGDAIQASLEAEGVDTSCVRRDPEHPTGVMLKDTGTGRVYYYRSRSAASRLRPSDLRGAPIAEARAVLVTGITAMIGDGPQRAALALLRSARGVRVVDPNLRPNLWGSDRAVELVTPLLRHADMVLGGEAELRTLVGGRTPAETAHRCQKLGPREIVLRSGKAGAAALDESGKVHEHRPPPEAEVDAIGAGDAFNAGYLAARLLGRPVRDALEQGARCGAAVVTQLGDTAGFPRLA
jgi:2-dehydro-3-deoxygluconokinase